MKRVVKRATLRPGAAVVAAPELRAAAAKLCSVRKCSLGNVTKMIRARHKEGARASLAIRKAKREETIPEKIRLARERAAAVGAARETDTCSLPGLKVRLKSLAHPKGATLNFLKSQFKARVTGRGWKYDSIGNEFRSKRTKN